MSLRTLDRWVRRMRDDLQALDMPKEVSETFGPYRDDPVAFCRDVLGVESGTRRSDGTPYQFRILEDLAQKVQPKHKPKS